jgi:hypothetical protein
MPDGIAVHEFAPALFEEILLAKTAMVQDFVALLPIFRN